MSWACNTSCMHTEAQKENFRRVAAHLGFNLDSLKVEYSPSGKTMHARQNFGPGWIFLRLRDGEFKIASCAADRCSKQFDHCRVALNNYYQTEWLTLDQALVYVPDMKEKFGAQGVLQLMAINEKKDI